MTDKAQPKLDSARHIFVLLMQFYLLRRRYRMSANISSIGVAEGQILVELAMKPNSTAADLSSILQIDKSTASRTLSNMRKKDLIVETSADDDKRLKLLSISSKGMEWVNLLRSSQQQLFEDCFLVLSVHEQNELTTLFRVLADGFGAKESQGFPGDHPITLEIVRLGRAFGMTGSNFFHSGLRSTEYFVLQCLDNQEADIKLSKLLEALPFDVSSLSRVVASLVQHGLITKEKDKNDGREHGLRIKDEGRKCVRRLELAAAKEIVACLKAGSNGEIAVRLIQLLQKLLKPQYDRVGRMLQPEIYVRPLINSAEKSLARGIFYEHLVREGKHFSAPETCYSEHGTSYGLFVNQQLKAVVEFDNKMLCLKNVAKSIDVREEVLEHFTTEVRKELRHSTGVIIGKI